MIGRRRLLVGTWLHVMKAVRSMTADKRDGLLGAVGRVTVSIPASGPGEVLIPVRGGTEAFAAWSDEPVARHTRVIVVDCISPRSVFVTPLPPGASG
jgi:hypothetical protein